MPFKIVMVREVIMLLALINGKLQVQMRGVSITEGLDLFHIPLCSLSNLFAFLSCESVLMSAILIEYCVPSYWLQPCTLCIIQ